MFGHSGTLEYQYPHQIVVLRDVCILDNNGFLATRVSESSTFVNNQSTSRLKKFMGGKPLQTPPRPIKGMADPPPGSPPAS